MRSHSDAEEAVSQTFLNIISHIEKISKLPDPKIMPYCVVIVKNEATNILRNRMKSVSMGELEADSGSYSSEVEDAWIHHIDKHQILLAIDRLSGADKHLVYLHYANDMSFKELADLLGVSEQTAKKRGYRILKKLRTFYEEGDENVQYI